jgi:hypothetical protein
MIIQVSMSIVAYKQAPISGACLYEYKPNSVEQPKSLVWSFTLAYCYQYAPAALSPYVSYTQKYGSTALHTSKDLAVSLMRFRMHIPEGTLAFRHRRHCSHLVDCSRRGLPATLEDECLLCVRTFLSIHINETFTCTE